MNVSHVPPFGQPKNLCFTVGLFIIFKSKLAFPVAVPFNVYVPLPLLVQVTPLISHVSNVGFNKFLVQSVTIILPSSASVKDVPDVAVSKSLNDISEYNLFISFVTTLFCIAFSEVLDNSASIVGLSFKSL